MNKYHVIKLTYYPGTQMRLVSPELTLDEANVERDKLNQDIHFKDPYAVHFVEAVNRRTRVGVLPDPEDDVIAIVNELSKKLKTVQKGLQALTELKTRKKK